MKKTGNAAAGAADNETERGARLCAWLRREFDPLYADCPVPAEVYCRSIAGAARALQMAVAALYAFAAAGKTKAEIAEDMIMLIRQSYQLFEAELPLELKIIRRHYCQAAKR